MKRFIIIIGAVSAIFLMASNVTAVPQIQSEPIMKNINIVKQQATLLEEKSGAYIEKITCLVSNILPKGIFDFLLSIISAIITGIINKIIGFVNSLTVFIQNVMQLVSTLFDAIQALINAINQFIDLIIGFFTSDNSEINQ